MALRHKTNPELFKLYDGELVLKIRNTRNLGNERRILSNFQQYLGNFPPSIELAKGFLARYSDRKPRTLARYSATIKSFMRWYGEPMDDFRIKIPRTLPPYTEDSDIEKLFSAIENKKSHKGNIVRDSLLVTLALSTGMRRSELANLKKKDIHADFLLVRKGKGKKERIVPIGSNIQKSLQRYLFRHRSKPAYQAIDNFFLSTQGEPLTENSIKLMFARLAKRSGVYRLHAHLCRHTFATRFLINGGDVFTLQQILGHSTLEMVRHYVNLASSHISIQHQRFSPMDRLSLR